MFRESSGRKKLADKTRTQRDNTMIFKTIDIKKIHPFPHPISEMGSYKLHLEEKKNATEFILKQLWKQYLK